MFGRTVRTAKSVAAADGWRGLYRGLSPNLAGNMASWGLYFAYYRWIKDQMAVDRRKGAIGRAGTSTLSPTQNLAAGALAGALTQLCANPLWVVKVRMCTTRPGDSGAYRGLVDGLTQIARKEGVAGLYRGLIPGLFGVSHGAIQFMVYEEMKKWRANAASNRDKERFSTTEYTVMSVASKTIAMVATYPYQV
ncbi:mitochondrial FAD carrier protein flx1, partial [Spiromyces aspiralis]